MRITIAGNTYQTGRLGGLASFHVARRLAPVMAALGKGALSTGLMQGMAAQNQVQQAEAPPEDLSLSDAELLMLMVPAMEVVAHMSDEDVDYIINACMSKAHKLVGETLAPLWIANRPMFPDETNMTVLLQLTVATVKENCGDFFAGGLLTPVAS